MNPFDKQPIQKYCVNKASVTSQNYNRFVILFISPAMLKSYIFVGKELYKNFISSLNKTVTSKKNKFNIRIYFVRKNMFRYTNY